MYLISTGAVSVCWDTCYWTVKKDFWWFYLYIFFAYLQHFHLLTERKPSKPAWAHFSFYVTLRFRSTDPDNHLNWMFFCAAAATYLTVWHVHSVLKLKCSLILGIHYLKQAALHTKWHDERGYDSNPVVWTCRKKYLLSFFDSVLP